MSSFKPAAELREFDRLALLPDSRAALDWLDRLRPAFLARRDPLTRARFLLRAGSLRDTRQPVQALIEDLIAALQVFHRSAQPRDAGLALARIGYWYLRLGLVAPGLACGRLALARPELEGQHRTRLLAVMASSLAQERLLPEAWALADQLVAGDDAPPLDRVLAWSVRAQLHCADAMRALRSVSVYALDLPPGPPDRTLAAQALAACGRCFERLPPPGPMLPMPHYTLAVYLALCGRHAEAQQTLAGRPEDEASPLARAIGHYNRGWCCRIAGDTEAALAEQGQALALLTGGDAVRLEAQICLELATVHEARGDAAVALGWTQRFLRAQAQMQQQAQRAVHRLAGLLGELTGAAVLTAVPSAAPVSALAAAAPPTAEQSRGGLVGDQGLLARAEALYLARLPRRLSFTRLAAELGVSLRTLQLVARRHRDTTLGEVLRRRLMQRALDLLCDGALPITEVAHQLGYADASTFSRDVRRHFGCTPRQLRAGLAAPAPAPAAAA